MHAGLLPLAQCRSRAGTVQLPPVVTGADLFEGLEAGWSALKEALKGRATFRRASANASTAFVQVLQEKTGLGEQGYRMEIQPQGIRIFAESRPGAFYGLQTLASLIREQDRKLPCMLIKDQPVLQRRGLYLDCSRGKVPTVDTVKRLIARLATWKMNELQLYIENTYAFKMDPVISRGFSPYTARDLKEIERCCTEHCVVFVPSLSSFGHFERILSLPAYQHLGEKPGLWGYPGGTTLDCNDRKSLALIEAMYVEFLPNFSSPWFNACCDETWELGKGKNATRVKRRGMGPVYLDFIKKLHKLSAAQGKQMHIWSDIVLNHPECIPKIPKDIVMLNWDYFPQGLRIKQSSKFREVGLDWMACPGSSAWKSHGSRYNHSFPNIQKFAIEAKRSGAIGLLHTDWGDYGHRNTLGVSLCSMAFAAAQAWAPGRSSFKDFVLRFAAEQVPRQAVAVAERLELLGEVEKRVGDYVPFQSFSTGVMGEDLHRGRIPPRSPVYQPLPFRKDWMMEAKANALPAVIADLKRLQPLPLKGDAWTRDFLDDLNLAVEMDRVACERILLARQWRDGHAISRATAKTFATAFAAMIGHFEKNWLRRNRPSRLKDNLRLLQAGLKDWETTTRPPAA